MESPGEYIRRERKLREISLQDVSKAIKVQAKLLKALEADDYDELPHPTFVKGFFRAYAKHLGLDDNDIVLRYEDYRKEFYDDIEQESVPPVTYPPATTAGQPRGNGEGEPRKKQLIAAAVIAGVVLVAAAYFVFSGSSEVTPLPEGAGLPAVASDKADGEVEESAATVKDSPEPVIAARVSASAGEKESASAKPSEVRKEPRKAVKTPVVKKQVKKEPIALPATVTAIPESGHTLVALANSETWMRVEIDGIKAKEVLLQPGESVTWRGAKGFSLLLGNAGGVTLTFDGVDMAPPGGVGKTVRVNYPKGIVLPRVVRKVAPKEAPKKAEEITKSKEEAVKEAPAGAGAVKEDSTPAEPATAEAEIVPEKAAAAGAEKAPVAPDAVKEQAVDETPAPSKTPVLTEAAPSESETTPPVEVETPSEAPKAQEEATEFKEETQKAAPIAVDAEDEAPAAPPVEESPLLEGAAEAGGAKAADPEDEIDLLEDDF